MICYGARMCLGCSIALRCTSLAHSAIPALCCPCVHTSCHGCAPATSKVLFGLRSSYHLCPACESRCWRALTYGVEVVGAIANKIRHRLLVTDPGAHGEWRMVPEWCMSGRMARWCNEQIRVVLAWHREDVWEQCLLLDSWPQPPPFPHCSQYNCELPTHAKQAFFCLLASHTTESSR